MSRRIHKDHKDLARNADGKSASLCAALLVGAGSVRRWNRGFMIATILPKIAGDLVITLGAAGQLMNAFTLAYAIGSPILTVLAGSLDRGELVIA